MREDGRAHWRAGVAGSGQWGHVVAPGAGALEGVVDERGVDELGERGGAFNAQEHAGEGDAGMLDGGVHRDRPGAPGVDVGVRGGHSGAGVAEERDGVGLVECIASEHAREHGHGAAVAEAVEDGAHAELGIAGADAGGGGEGELADDVQLRALGVGHGVGVGDAGVEARRLDAGHGARGEGGDVDAVQSRRRRVRQPRSILSVRLRAAARCAWKVFGSSCAASPSRPSATTVIVASPAPVRLTRPKRWIIESTVVRSMIA